MSTVIVILGLAACIVDFVLIYVYRQNRERYRRAMYWVFPLAGIVLGVITSIYLELQIGLAVTFCFGLALMNWNCFHVIASNRW